MSRYGGNQEDIVLVGHSAGAHLAALCLSDARWLEEVGIVVSTGTTIAPATTAAQEMSSTKFGQPPAPPTTEPKPSRATAHARRGPTVTPKMTASKPVVSGFVGISGVYDIPRLAGNVVGGALARAAFGNSRRTWKEASPVHCVRAAAAAALAAAAAAAVRLSAAEAAAAAMATTAAATGSMGSRSLRVGTVPATKGVTSNPDRVEEEVGTIAEVAADFVGSGTGSGVGTASTAACPLLDTKVLLLTASSDFHLQDDAEALADALHHARRNRYSLVVALLEAVGRGRLTGTESTTCTVPPSDGEVRSGGMNEQRRGGSGDVGGGSARHVCLHGEDHLSTIVSFGEPGKRTSDIVLEFILGLPSPRP